MGCSGVWDACRVGVGGCGRVAAACRQFGGFLGGLGGRLAYFAAACWGFVAFAQVLWVGRRVVWVLGSLGWVREVCREVRF